MRHLAAAAVLLVLGGAPAAPFAAADATDSVSRVVPLSPGMPIHVDATIADVTIAGTNRADLKIDVDRRAPARDRLSQFPVAIDVRADGIYIAARQPGDARDAALKATISIAAPADAVVKSVRVAEGRVRIENLRRACDVELQRGAIEAIDVGGRVRLDAGLGSVDVRGAELTAGGMMRLRVFNGPLRVRFARAPANARILALTFNGAISSDIPLTMKDRFGPRFGESTIGTGDPVLSMDVVKGDISLAVDAR